jgi:signal transduction histidine kinase
MPDIQPSPERANDILRIGEFEATDRIEARQEDSVAQVIDKIRRTLDLETIFQTTAIEVRQLLSADRVAVFRFDPEASYQSGQIVSEEVVPKYLSALNARIEDRCFGDKHVPEYRRGKSWAIEDVESAELLDCHRHLLQRFQVRANLVVPLLQGEHLWGLLCIHQCSGPRQWQETEIQFVSKIAVHLGIAIQQAELLYQTRQRSEELQCALSQVKAQKEHLAGVAAQERAMARVIQRVRQTLDQETIFQATTEEVRQLLQCDRVIVYRFNEDWSGEFCYESLAEGWRSLTGIPGLRLQWEDTYLQETQGGRYREHETFAINDVHQANLSDCHLSILEYFQIKAFVVAPVFVGDTLWGLLGAYQQSDYRDWTLREIGLLAQVGDQLGVAVHQSRLLARTKQQSRELQQTLADLTAIVDNLADGLLVTDIYGRITRFNPALLSMFALENRILSRQQLADVFPSQVARLVSAPERTREEMITARVELGGGREGQALVTSILKAPEGEEGVQCLGSVILIRDVTEERALDRLKNEFLANVSHELRTPLTPILGFAALIRENLERVIFPAIVPDDPKVRKVTTRVNEHIDIIVREAERLTELIDNVLDIAKMEAGRIDWVFQPIAPSEFLERAIAIVEPLCRQKNLTLIQIIDRDLPLVMADKNRLIQVLLNLFSNAIKFTERGDIECRAAVEDDRLVVSVRDTGIGISSEDRVLIFERFKQVGNILTDKPKGAGLGLPICKQIIESHGGEIGVESLMGEGSTFYFTLPISREALQMQVEIQSINRLFGEEK